jgi:hypothetical protein
MATTPASAINRRARSVFKLFIDKSLPNHRADHSVPVVQLADID